MKKNSGMRKRMRNDSEDENLTACMKPVWLTWFATTKIMVKPRMASSHSSLGFLGNVSIE